MDEAFYRPRKRETTDNLPLFGEGEVAPKKAPRTQFYDVPVRTRLAECRGCKAVIYWVRSPVSDAFVPIDCDFDSSCHQPTATEPGRGVSHFLTCPDADQFSGRGRARGT